VAAVAVSEAGHPPRPPAQTAGGGPAQGAGVRLAVAGATPNPIRMTALEGALAGPPPAEARLPDIERQVAEAMDPRTDFRGSAEYRRAMAGVVARRAIQMLMEKG
jgi:aerobic carbon-monoxide dehydrogenase medium subunit